MRFISNTGNTAAPAGAENPPKPAKPLQEGKPAIAERIDFVGLGVPGPRPRYAGVNSCVEDAHIQSSGQIIANHRIPIFIAINVAQLVLFNFSHRTGRLALLLAPSIVFALDDTAHCWTARIVGVVGIAAFPFQGDGKAALEVTDHIMKLKLSSPNWL